MTIYVHGRPLREVRTRRRRVVAEVLLGAAILSGAVWSVQRSGVAAHPAPSPTALDPQLQQRFDAAAQEAEAEGVTLTINAGWRSHEDQQAVLDKAIARYGATEARRWALPPGHSAHERGLAIDVGDAAGARWLTVNGSRFGLCRVYENEPWHFEPKAEPGHACPAMVADASVDW
jgi:hypothetical protein